MLSHNSSGADIGDSLVGMMARQLGLSKRQFTEFVECSLSREDFDALQAPQQENTAQS
jgi:hypothetical protein